MDGAGVSADGEDANGAGAFAGLRFVGLAGILEEGEHGGVAADPVLETGGDAEGGCARRVGCRGVLPTDVSEDKMLCGIGRPEVVDVRRYGGRRAWGGLRPNRRGPKSGERVGGVWPDVALLAVIRVRRANRACRMDWMWGLRHTLCSLDMGTGQHAVIMQQTQMRFDTL